MARPEQALSSRYPLRCSPSALVELQALPGWSWGTSRQEQWATTYAALCAYTAEHGTALVPATHVAGDVPLGSWVSRQRSAHRHHTLPAARATALQRLPGMDVELPRPATRTP